MDKRPPEQIDTQAPDWPCNMPANYAHMNFVPGMRVGNIKRMFVVLAVAVPMLALTNSEALMKWTQSLPEGAISRAVIDGAAGWYDFTDRIGAAHVFDALREAFHSIQRH
ncbi:MAG: hypothetical protein AB7G15_13240 [Alphaproteobacteria bacterium]